MPRPTPVTAAATFRLFPCATTANPRPEPVVLANATRTQARAALARLCGVSPVELARGRYITSAAQESFMFGPAAIAVLRDVSAR